MDNLFFCLKIKNFTFKINFFQKKSESFVRFFRISHLTRQRANKKQNLEDTKMKDYSKMLNEEITWKSDAEILEFESKYKNYILNVLREKKYRRTQQPDHL